MHFLLKNTEIPTPESISEHVELLNAGYQNMDFESETTDRSAAMKDLKEHRGTNTEALKNFTSDTTLTSIVPYLYRIRVGRIIGLVRGTR